MKILIKLGGTLLDSPASRDRLARELADLQSAAELVVVHGGGKQMTRFLSERGVESSFVGGLRVTTPDVIDAVLKVLAGSVNHELLAALAAAGSNAVGLSGIDACIVEAEPMHADLGAVGRPVRCNPAVLNLLASNGYLPVIACVAGDRQGRVYNVNADQMAVACAAGFHADRLLFLTDVDGVRGADSSILPTLSPAACNALISSGVATGGMQAKLNAACDALAAGIGQVVIAPGALAGAAGRILAGEPIGTRLVPEGSAFNA
ncbi:MAG TPA: acetylglutamate kinase [Bryobacteraceae bacterium]|nr:acetylglutamate kinase [Bryobacteraceae bacterium]